MFLDTFYQLDQELISITPQQGSRFAKEIANDFNPLHNADSKRFCVPGDLLFSLVLHKQGLSQNMTFKYTGMVGKDAALKFPENASDAFAVTDKNDKSYLEVSRSGAVSDDQQLIENFARAYVAFSGLSFPHILVPLMEKNRVMINPDRPMVIYESMAFELHGLNLEKPELKLTDSSLEVQGKRGLVQLNFDILENGIVVGTGYKTMTLGGLREYDSEKMQSLVDLYEQSKQEYRQVA